MREVHLIATIGENSDDKNQGRAETGHRQAEWSPKGPTRSFAHQHGQQSVTGSAQYQAPLETDARQQHETCEQRAGRRPGRIEQGGEASAVHPIFHADLNARDDGRKQNSRQERDGEH